MNTENISITSIDTLKKYAEGDIVRFPDFAEGKPFVARIRRPSMMGLVKQGKIPNSLLQKANELFTSGVSGALDEDNIAALAQMFELMETMCEASFMEPTYQEIKDSGITLTDEQLMFVYNYSQAGVKALGLNNCAAHAELKLKEGKPYLMEIGARLGGDFISTELTHLSTGVDMVAASINVALGIEPDFKPKEAPKGVCIRYFTPLPGKLLTIKNHELLNDSHVYDAEIYYQVGDVIPEVRSSLDRSGHVIVTHDTVQQATVLADKIVEGIEFVVEKK